MPAAKVSGNHIAWLEREGPVLAPRWGDMFSVLDGYIRFYKGRKFVNFKVSLLGTSGILCWALNWTLRLLPIALCHSNLVLNQTACHPTQTFNMTSIEPVICGQTT